jgi:hypothetical protein
MKFHTKHAKGSSPGNDVARRIVQPVQPMTATKIKSADSSASGTVGLLP